jgi:GAF domain-containing protein
MRAGLLDRIVRRDPEARALHALARAVDRLAAKRRPDESLQVVVDIARDLTGSRYAALSVTDSHDRVEGFITSGLSDAELRRLRTPPQGHGPLGSLREDGRPVRYDNVEDHRNAFGFPGSHPEMERLIGVAIWVDGEVRGSLYATDRADGRQFSDHDERIMLTLAEHAAQVIDEEWY